MGLLRFAREHEPEGMEIKIADISDVPFYNADLKEKTPAVLRLLADLEQADALLLGCPEYNYSLAPALKNALDWASREKDNHLLAGKAAAIMGSGGGMGTSRSQYHLRQVCVFLDLHPLNKPEVFCNAFAGNFDADGNLTGDKIQELIIEQLGELKTWVHRLRD
jgi:chromate reductase